MCETQTLEKSGTLAFFSHSEKQTNKNQGYSLKRALDYGEHITD